MQLEEVAQGLQALGQLVHHPSLVSCTNDILTMNPEVCQGCGKAHATVLKGS